MQRTWNKNWRKSVIVLSGGFDPIHKGHMRMFREASWLGHQVRTTYNGGMFNHNYEGNNPTGRNDYEIYFANGGDRTTDNVPEMDTCRELDITMLWGVGGGKIQSSSWLINNK